MGILSSSISLVRYKVTDTITGSIMETVAAGLKKNVIQDIDGSALEKTVGWTSFDSPYNPDFEGSSFVIGTYFVFSLRIDKKNIPSKIIKKYFNKEMAKQLADGKRRYLSRNEKRVLKEQVFNMLCLRVPATPNIYDVIWDYEKSRLWFFSNLKSANEDFETIFSKSFKLSLVRLLPYTMAYQMPGLSDAERDIFVNLSPAEFKE